MCLFTISSFKILKFKLLLINEYIISINIHLYIYRKKNHTHIQKISEIIWKKIRRKIFLNMKRIQFYKYISLKNDYH